MGEPPPVALAPPVLGVAPPVAAGAPPELVPPLSVATAPPVVLDDPFEMVPASEQPIRRPTATSPVINTGWNIALYRWGFEPILEHEWTRRTGPEAGKKWEPLLGDA